MNRCSFSFVLAFASSLAFATPSVDFSVTPSGTANPLLHSTGFMSTVKDHKTAHSDFVKNAKFGSSRTHSWAEADMNQRVCDLQHVFPLSLISIRPPRTATSSRRRTANSTMPRASAEST